MATFHKIYGPARPGIGQRTKLPDVVQGSRDVLFLQWLNLDGTPFDLSAATAVTASFYKEHAASTVYSSDGVFTVTSGVDGQFTWSLGEGDSGTAGTWLYYFEAVIGGLPVIAGPVQVTVTANPEATAVAAEALVGVSSTEAAWLTALHTAAGAATDQHFAIWDGNQLADSGVPIPSAANPYYDDFRVPVTSINPPGAVNDPDFDTAYVGYLFSATAQEQLQIIAQLPHTWQEGSAIEPHLHWAPTTAAAGNVVWRFEYEWTNIDGVQGGVYTAVDITVPAGGTAYQIKLSSFGAVAGTGKTASSILTIKISRVGTDAADTYPADVLLKEFDFHYARDSFGESSLP